MDEVVQEFVVPKEATERGPLVLGVLKSDTTSFPSILAQLSKVNPSSRKAKIYLYPTLDQVKALFEMRSPFSFLGEYRTSDELREVWSAEEIWLESGSEIGGGNRKFWSAPFGTVRALRCHSGVAPDLEERGGKE